MNLAEASQLSKFDCSQALSAQRKNDFLGHSTISIDSYLKWKETFASLDPKTAAGALRERLNTRRITAIDQITAMVAFLDAFSPTPAYAALVEGLGQVQFKYSNRPGFFKWGLSLKGRKVVEIKNYYFKSDSKVLEAVWKLALTLTELDVGVSYWPWKNGICSFPVQAATATKDCVASDGDISEAPSNEVEDRKIAQGFKQIVEVLGPSRFATRALQRLTAAEQRVLPTYQFLTSIDSSLQGIAIEERRTHYVGINEIRGPLMLIAMGTGIDYLLNSDFGFITGAAAIAGTVAFTSGYAFPKFPGTSPASSGQNALPFRLKSYWFTSNLIRAFLFSTMTYVAVQNVPKIPSMIGNVGQFYDVTVNTMGNLVSNLSQLDPNELDRLARQNKRQATAEIEDLIRGEIEQLKVDLRDEPGNAKIKSRIEFREKELANLIQVHGNYTLVGTNSPTPGASSANP